MLKLPAHLRTASHQISDGLKLLKFGDLNSALPLVTQALRCLLSFRDELIELRFCSRRPTF